VRRFIRDQKALTGSSIDPVFCAGGRVIVSITCAFNEENNRIPVNKQIMTFFSIAARV
jgi:hypothetical protein